LDYTVACSHIACPLNYDCERFKNFLDSEYSFCEEFAHNGNLTCDSYLNNHTSAEDKIKIVPIHRTSLF
jgi:hypothetical protein